MQHSERSINKVQPITLRANNLVKSYSGRKIINDVSLEIKSNQVTGLLGPNGAGKTTCFYMLLGIIGCYKGSIYLNDTDITHLPLHKRAIHGIGYLPQEASIFRNMSVRDNILSILQLNKLLSRKEQYNKLDELIDEFNLSRIVDNIGLSLSGGERRRVEIARTLAIEPKFVLLDEPFAGVDPISIDDVNNLIRAVKNKGIGVLITDHNVREILHISDYTYTIGEGKVIAQGDKDTILNNEMVKSTYLGVNFNI
jgi:lipopolysaccharide export system ATP-binding protein